MNAQELLDEAMPRLSDEHLANYVRQYETDASKIVSGDDWTFPRNGCNCAARFMDGEGSIEEMRKNPALRRIECLFEGYTYDLPELREEPQLFGVYLFADPRRAIYEACITEQARRSSLSVPPQQQTVEVSQ